MSKPRPGKVLEAEIRQFFKSAAAWSHGFDNIGASDARCPRCFQPMARLNAPRPADRIACYRGLSVLVECKETGKTSLPLENLQAHQERHLQAHHEAGGVSLLVIRQNIPRAPRAWVILWDDWPALFQALAGRVSVPLLDRTRPDCVRELTRRRLHPHDPGPTWDLSVYLDPIAARREP
jgi:hypothetical protein